MSRVPAPAPPGHLVDTAPVDEVPDAGALVVEVAGRRIALVRDGAGVQALDATCTHASGPVEAVPHAWAGDAAPAPAACLLVCAWHGAAFDPANGEVRRGPARKPLRRYAAEVVGGVVRVTLT